MISFLDMIVRFVFLFQNVFVLRYVLVMSTMYSNVASVPVPSDEHIVEKRIKRKLLPGRNGSWTRLGLLQLFPLLLGEQCSSNFPADVMTIVTGRGDLETLLQKGLLDVMVEGGVRCFDGSDIRRGE